MWIRIYHFRSIRIQIRVFLKVEAWIMGDIKKVSYYVSKCKFRFVFNFCPTPAGLTEKPSAKGRWQNVVWFEWFPIIYVQKWTPSPIRSYANPETNWKLTNTSSSFRSSIQSFANKKIRSKVQIRIRLGLKCSKVQIRIRLGLECSKVQIRIRLGLKWIIRFGSDSKCKCCAALRIHPNAYLKPVFLVKNFLANASSSFRSAIQGYAKKI